MDVPHIVAVPLDPGDWPQDNLRVPDTSSGLRIEQNNFQITKRDPYCITGSISVAQNATGVINFDVSQAGDFWCTSIAIFSRVTTPYSLQPWARMTMEDVRTGYKFFRPYTWVNVFNGIAQAGIVGETTPAFDATVFSPIPRTGLPTPYMFIRGGNILISLSRPTQGAEPADTVTYYICLDGWLEYENAS